MTRFIVQRYCARNDPSGNPRRVYVVRDMTGRVISTVDEGYEGPIAMARELFRLGANKFDHRSSYDWQHSPDVIDIGSVDVGPGVYNRMRRYRVT